jgi:peptidyl-prolyl cis-trans isomerase D
MIRFLQTPGPIKKIILSGMLLLICAAMVITFIPGGLASSFGIGGLAQGVVAQVGGEEITTDEVNRTLDMMIKTQFPQAGAQANMLRPYFSQRAVDQLIGQKAMLFEAHRLGLKASDEEVRDEFQHGRYAAYFFPGGKFIGNDQYQTLLANNNLTVERFENSVKNELVLAKLRNLVAGSIAVSDLDIRREFEQRNLKVKFDYAVLTREDILKGIHPSDAELKAYYEANKSRYINATPEKRKVSYVLVDTTKLEAQTKVTNEELQSYYNQHREEYRVPEQVNVRHILIKTPDPGPDGKADPKGVEEARAKAADVLKQLKAGAKFEDLAKKYSQDPGSGANGGSLGWIGKGRTVPEFEKAAFSLPKGGISDLVQSSYGFHIIRVDDKQDAHVKSLDEVKAQIEPIIKQQNAAKAADAEAKAVLDAARVNGLEKAATAKGLQVVTTDFFARTDSLPGIGNSPQFAEAVFGATEKTPADQVQIPQGTAVFKLLAIKPAATPSYDEIRSRVESEFKNERSSSLLAQKTQELSDRAKTSHDLKKAAKEVGATVKTSDFVSRDGQVPDIGPMSGPASVAFTMKSGEISGPIQGGGNGIVLAVVDVQQPASDTYAAKQDEIRDSLRASKQDELFTVFVSTLRDQMQKSGKIKINQDELKKLAGPQSREEGE